MLDPWLCGSDFCAENDRFGSVAACRYRISSRAALEGKAASQQALFRFPNLNGCFSPKRSFKTLEILDSDRPLSANSGHCDVSVSALRSKPFAGPFFGLPDGRVGIVGADDCEESFTLAGLSGLLAYADGSKTWIVI